jgi:hypothetical protein
LTRMATWPLASARSRCRWSTPCASLHHHTLAQSQCMRSHAWARSAWPSELAALPGKPVAGGERRGVCGSGGQRAAQETQGQEV